MGVRFLMFELYFFLRLRVSFLTFEGNFSYVWGLVFLRLVVTFLTLKG